MIPVDKLALLLWRRRTRLGHVKGFRELLVSLDSLASVDCQRE